jgi:2-desacetyl-2-hydroxyethyl bacteriochlorophyllide A dehydrogenase
VRALRLNRLGSDLTEEEIADPVAGAGEILVEIRAAGICHSDAHYRAGKGRVNLPLTLGHEIAGIDAATGRRVALHYLLPNGDMLGKERDGGYAERVVVPANNAVPIPDEVPFEHAAIMMCSSATAMHALGLASVQRGESVLLLGFGGLGVSAVQLARIRGADVFVQDVVPEKVRLAETFGALPAKTGSTFDVVLDFAGHAPATLQALRALRPGGRLMIVAINLRTLEIDPYADVLAKERRIIGVADHTREELFDLMQLARDGVLDLSRAITRTVPLDARAVNDVLDELDRGTTHLRTVIAR